MHLTVDMNGILDFAPNSFTNMLPYVYDSNLKGWEEISS